MRTVGGVSAPSSADTVHVSTPSQSLTSGPWRILGGKGVLQPPFEVTSPHFSPSSSLSSHSPISSGGSGNPSDSSQIATDGRKEARAWLPHEVRDHPDVDLSARLVHLWNHSIEVGVCREIFVPSSNKLSFSSSELVTLHGANPVNQRWSTLGGDTQSFSQVLQAPSLAGKNIDQRPFPLNRFNQGFEGNRGGGFRPVWQGQGNRGWVPRCRDRGGYRFQGGGHDYDNRTSSAIMSK